MKNEKQEKIDPLWDPVVDKWAGEGCLNAKREPNMGMIKANYVKAQKDFKSLESLFSEDSISLSQFVKLHEFVPGGRGGGRIAISARGYNILIRKLKDFGHMRFEQITEGTFALTKAFIKRRSEDFEHELHFSIEDCQALGPVNRKYPRSAMLARLTTMTAGWIFPELYECIGMSSEEQRVVDKDDAVSHSDSASQRSGPKEVNASRSKGPSTPVSKRGAA